MNLNINTPALKNIITLMTGTTIAQAMPIAISPILTRLYSPEDFGVFGLYMAIASIASVFVSGRYELAIMLPKSDDDALNIVFLSLTLSSVISAVMLLLITLFDYKIAKLLGSPGIRKILYLLPVSIFLMGAYQAINYWANRKGLFKATALSRVSQGGSTSLLQMTGGYQSFGSMGLVGGQLFGQLLSILVLIVITVNEKNFDLSKIHPKRIIAVCKKYSKFPKYLVAAHSINIGASQMPVLFLSASFGSAIAGYYSLTYRVLSAPISLLASAVGDVYLYKASSIYAHSGNCRRVYMRTLKYLIAISILPFAIFFFTAPQIFIFIFGEEWGTSGLYAQILTPMFFLKFIVGPLSSMFTIAERQKLDLSWQIVIFSLVLLAFLSSYTKSNVEYALIAYSFSYCLRYLANGFLSYRIADGK
jgi:O-antigen/teichoic acid export membrane protein